MPGKPDDTSRLADEIENAEDRPTLTDRLNKYLLCAYLNRLNEEDRRGDDVDDQESTDVRRQQQQQQQRGETSARRDGDGF